jgi:hypothetical protein
MSANRWITDLQIIERPPSTYLDWQWSAQKPRLAGDPRLLIPPEMWGQNGTIQLIYLPTGLTYGEVSLLLGRPSHGAFAVSSSDPLTLSTRPNTRHLAVYFNGSVSFDMRLICPVNLDLFWSAPVSVAYISDTLVQSQTIFSYDLARWLYGQPCNA